MTAETSPLPDPPEGKIRCSCCHEVVRPDRVDNNGVCVNCRALGKNQPAAAQEPRP